MLDWTEIEDARIKATLGQFPDDTRFRHCVPPFFTHGHLIRAENEEWGDTRSYAVECDGRFVGLTGQTQDAAAACALAGVQVTRESLADYLVFHAYFTRAEGQSLVLGPAYDFLTPVLGIADQDASDAMDAVDITGSNPDGGLLCSYSALVRSELVCRIDALVMPDGRVEVKSSKRICVCRMPLRVELDPWDYQIAQRRERKQVPLSWWRRLSWKTTRR
ncbi:MAG: hypothetical protein AB7Q01_02330 [Gammaproteobacteria bacterium]